MEGFQYAHLELFSVKGAPGAEGQGTGKRKNGARAWGVSDVLDEAERTPHSSHHVIADRPKPQVISGMSRDFAALREAHAKASSLREKFNYTKKDGSKQVRRRKLRADAPTLYSSVYSLPVRSEDALKDTALRTECERVLREAMDHERRRIVALGGSVELGVIHWDEEFAHIHILALNRSRGRVDHLHPGRKAKTEFHEANKNDEDRAGVRRAANKAYCDALRNWQDDVFEAVSKKAGLLRYGPKRFRLSRKDYMTAKAIAAKRAEDEKLDEARAGKDARSARKAKDADLLFQGGQTEERLGGGQDRGDRRRCGGNRQSGVGLQPEA